MFIITILSLVISFVAFIIVVAYSNPIDKLKKDYLELLDAFYKLEEKYDKLEHNVKLSYTNVEYVINKHADIVDDLADQVDELEQCIKDGSESVFFESDFDLPSSGNNGDLN